MLKKSLKSLDLTIVMLLLHYFQKVLRLGKKNNPI
jgi:hypothetical protein